MNNICYTVLMGKYEEIKEPLIITPGWQYMCFTDQEINSKNWSIITVSKKDNPILAARAFKIEPPEADNSIYVDASFTINVNLDEFWNKHFISPMTVIPHPWRKNVYAEAQACITHNRDDVHKLAAQSDFYHSQGIPSGWPVIQSGILMRENTKEVRALCELWWDQIKLSTRDQIGFAYAEWKMPGVAHRMKEPIDYRTSQEFIYKTHFNRR